MLDYQLETTTTQSVYLVEVANTGYGPEEDLRLQMIFPEALAAAYFKEPEVKIYKPSEVSFENNKFYMALTQFPKNAAASVSFEFKADKEKLCDIGIKIAGQKEEGKVEAIKGIACDTFSKKL